ncbi:hypothetical protein [Burkholderia multivorans]|uniref:hypothetical protein n=1 Tax=Burkholderia multivorans TaxID=87883 RepID=UPI0011B26077|nr:hypothetical protein [Burkholderia multivorans]MBU9210969.1 hypothetical protein [Burkholderia multivorans]MBY4793254.1 hypothetical protein [Burkholderia multivorans]
MLRDESPVLPMARSMPMSANRDVRGVLPCAAATPCGTRTIFVSTGVALRSALSSVGRPRLAMRTARCAGDACNDAMSVDRRTPPTSPHRHANRHLRAVRTVMFRNSAHTRLFPNATDARRGRPCRALPAPPSIRAPTLAVQGRERNGMRFA